MPFSTLGLDASITRAIEEINYQKPTLVQEASIPAIIEGSDIRACAQTGSGKTAAFVLPILQSLLSAPRKNPVPTRALILAPTRELAVQINDVVSICSRYMPTRITSQVLVGGVSINPQMMSMRSGADVIVATPGRLIDLVEKNAVTLDQLEVLVLDEADRLLELGFSEEIRTILDKLPKKRQNLLFSATFPKEVTALADNLLQEPVIVAIEHESVSKPDILHRAIEVDHAHRTQLLRNLIETHAWEQVLVFTASAYSTEHVANKLTRLGIDNTVLHGKLSQGTRTRSLESFKSGKTQVLLCTDLASRGLDIVDLPVVFNYDLPRSPNDYIHRIGRTGRAGASGVAISFVTVENEAHFRLIEKRNKLRIPRERIVGFEPDSWERPASTGTGGIKGKRPSKKDKIRAAAAEENRHIQDQHQQSQNS